MVGFRGHRPSRDSNHAEIVAALKGVGCYVLDLSAVGGGCPDILAARNGWMWLIEIKGCEGNPMHARDPSKPDWEWLTDAQIEFFSKWTGPKVAIVKSVAEALDVVAASTEEIEAWTKALASRVS